MEKKQLKRKSMQKEERRKTVATKRETPVKKHPEKKSSKITWDPAALYF